MSGGANNSIEFGLMQLEGVKNQSKIATICEKLEGSSPVRQAQAASYLNAVNKLPAEIDSTLKVRLVANELCNATEEGFESRLDALTKIDSEDDAYHYMNASYQQETSLAYGSTKDLVGKVSAKPETGGIEQYLNSGQSNQFENKQG